MTFTIDVDNIENNNFQLTEDGNGDLVLTHKSTGATFDYDSTNNQWIASDGIKTPALEAERIANNYAYAGAFSGSDADARLDNCLSSVSSLTTVYLEEADYSDNRTISQSIQFIGTRTATSGTAFTGSITCDKVVSFDGVVFTDSLTLKGNRSYIHNCNPFLSTAVDISAFNCSYVNNRGGDVTLNGDGNIVDSCTQTSVTDNGTGNVVGDIV